MTIDNDKPTPSPSVKVKGEVKDEIEVGVPTKPILQDDEEAQVSDKIESEELNYNYEGKNKTEVEDKIKRTMATSPAASTSSLRGSGSLRRSGTLRRLSSGLKLRKRRNKKKKSDFHYRSRPIPEELDVGDDGEAAQEQDGLKKRNNRLTPLINYEVFQWTWFIILCLLAIVDRFTWNVWPRQTFSIGAGSAGSDRLSGFKPG